MHKWDIGDKVIYNGLVGTIVSKDIYAGSGNPCYGLVACEDEEVTCTADEYYCRPYHGQEIDQHERLVRAKFESNSIAARIDSVTDKYIGDCGFKI